MSTAQTEEKAKRVRKPRPRHRDIIIGCIEERLAVLFGKEDNEHVIRVIDLMDELKRSIGKGDDEE